MKTNLLDVLVAVLIGAGDDAKDKAIKADLAKLQGTYKMASLEVDGKSVAEEKLKSSMLTIKGDKYIVKVNDEKYETQMILDPQMKPKIIDIKFLDGDNKDKTALGIYKIEDDTLTMCRALKPGEARPDEFITRADTNTFLVVWKKQQDKK